MLWLEQFKIQARWNGLIFGWDMFICLFIYPVKVATRKKMTLSDRNGHFPPKTGIHSTCRQCIMHEKWERSMDNGFI